MNRRFLIFFLLFSLISWSLPVFSQGTPGVFAPDSGATLNETITITGTAVDPNFLRYELAFLQEANPGAGWIVFAAGDQPVSNGTLAVWDTTLGQNVGASVYPDGVYQLRLRVVRNDFSFDEYFTNGLQIANGQSEQPEQPTQVPVAPADIPTSEPPTAVPANEGNGEPTPTLIPAIATLPSTAVPTPTPIPTLDVPTPLPTSDNVEPEPQLDVLPSLTPFPSPVPQATPDRGGFVAEDGSAAEPQPFSIDTAVDMIFGFDYSVMGRGFRQGIFWTLVLFAVMGVYMLVRSLVRWIWRMISSNF